MQKLILLSLFIITTSVSKAQLVTIPDSSFLSFLELNFPSAVVVSTYLDTSAVEITKETSIDCSGLNIKDLFGIQFFDSLKELKCYDNQLTYLPALPNSLTLLYCWSNQLSNLPELPSSLEQVSLSKNQLTNLPSLPSSVKILECGNNQLTKLPLLPISLVSIHCEDNQLTNLPKLHDSIVVLLCNNNQLTELPDLPESLLRLNCSENQLTSLPFLPSELISVNCSSNQLTSLPTLPSSLELLSCVSNQLTTLPSLNNSLEWLSCTNNQLTILPDLPSSLERLYCDSNHLTTLPSLNDSLEWLNCSNNQLTTLPALTNSLRYLNGGFNDIIEVDISKNLKLFSLLLNDNALLKLNVRNGNNKYLDLNTIRNPNLKCITVDDEEWSMTNWTSNVDSMTGFSENCLASIFNPLVKFTICPNPSSDIIHLQNINRGHITIYNLLGKTVMHRRLEEGYLDISSLLSGQYIIQVDFDNKVYRSRLVKD